MKNIKIKSRLALFAIFLTITGFAISANAVPPLVTTIAKQINVPYEAFGYIFMIQYLCFTIGAFGGSALRERFGLPLFKLIAAGIIGAGVFLMLGNLLHGFWWFVVWIIPIGICGGLIETFGSIMVAEFEETDSSRLVNLSQMFYCIGAIFAPFAVVALLKNEISWRSIFLILGTLILAIGIFFEIVNRKRATAFSGIKPAVTAGSKKESVAWHRDVVFYLLAFSLFLYVTIENCTASWVAAYFEKGYGLAASDAAWRLSVFWCGIIIGRGLMVVLPGRLTLWPALSFAGAGMMIGNVFLTCNCSPMTATAGVLLSGIFFGPVWPVTIMVSQNLRNSTSFTSGVIGAGAVGAAAGPLVGSFIIKYFGLTRLFPTLAGLSAVLFITVLYAKRKSFPGRVNGGISL